MKMSGQKGPGVNKIFMNEHKAITPSVSDAKSVMKDEKVTKTT